MTGPGAVLIAQDLPAQTAGVRAMALADPALAFAREALTAWLAQHDAAAVLVRPDHHVFGTGDPAVLIAAWQQRAMTPLPAKSKETR